MKLTSLFSKEKKYTLTEIFKFAKSDIKINLLDLDKYNVIEHEKHPCILSTDYIIKDNEITIVNEYKKINVSTDVYRIVVSLLNIMKTDSTKQVWKSKLSQYEDRFIAGLDEKFIVFLPSGYWNRLKANIISEDSLDNKMKKEKIPANFLIGLYKEFKSDEKDVFLKNFKEQNKTAK